MKSLTPVIPLLALFILNISKLYQETTGRSALCTSGCLDTYCHARQFFQPYILPYPEKLLNPLPLITKVMEIEGLNCNS